MHLRSLADSVYRSVTPPRLNAPVLRLQVIMCHPTSHLLNNEADAYKELCGFTAHGVGDPTDSLGACSLKTQRSPRNSWAE